MQLCSEEIDGKMINAVKDATYAVAKRSLKKFRFDEIWTVTFPILVQLFNQSSYQANWELMIIKMVCSIRVVIKWQGLGFPWLLWLWPPATFKGKQKKKNRTNDSAHLLVVFTWQLEILVTTLIIPGKGDVTIVRQMINGESTIHIPSYLPWWRYYFILVVTSSLSCLIACYHILYNLEWTLLSIIQN